MDSGIWHSRNDTTLNSFEVIVVGFTEVSLNSTLLAGTTGYMALGSLPERARWTPHGCCQHLRAAFQWKPSSFNLALISRSGGTLNSSHTHLPTTCARLQISGTSVFIRSSSASVLVSLASFAFMVTLSVPSTRCTGLLLVWLLSLEARTAFIFQQEQSRLMAD